MRKLISSLILGCLLSFVFVGFALSAPSGVNDRINYRKILNDYCNNYLEADYGSMYIDRNQTILFITIRQRANLL